MAKIELRSDEIISFVKPKLPKEVKNLKTTSNGFSATYKKKFDIPLKVDFSNFHNGTLFLKVKLDFKIPVFKEQVNSNILNLLTPFIPNLHKAVKIDGSSVKIKTKYFSFSDLEIADIKKNGDKYIIMVGDASKKQNNITRFVEYYSANGDFIHRFETYSKLEAHFWETKEIAYSKNYYIFYPSEIKIPIENIHSNNDLGIYWES